MWLTLRAARTAIGRFDELIKKANQTKAYIVFLHKQSSSEN